MARHRKSKKNVVQINPDATLNYVSGILTGANNYISGLLEGANQYNAWVQTEMSLEGTDIGGYKPNALREFLEDLTESEYTKLMTDPYGYIMTLKQTNQQKFNELINSTNYRRLIAVDRAMIKAGKQYRDQIPTLIKSRNVETGLTLLETYAPSSAKVVDKINGILTSSIKVNV